MRSFVLSPPIPCRAAKLFAGAIVADHFVRTLSSLVPDVDVLLALDVEELAEVIFQVAAATRQNGLAHLQQITPGDFHGVQARYPESRRREVELACAEGWNWLIVHGVLVPDPGINGSNGFMVLSRRGEKLLEEGQFRTYAQSINFPKALIHSSITDDVWLDLARGDLETAVFKAFRAVEIAVRHAGGYAETEIGTALMRKAFDRASGPLSDMNQPEPEREALAHLFAGAIGSYKNPHSHRTVAINDPREAHEMILLASHLLRIVGSRQKP